MQKLFKGGNYSRAETICGNTVFCLSQVQRIVRLKYINLDNKMEIGRNLFGLPVDIDLRNQRLNILI